MKARAFAKIWDRKKHGLFMEFFFLKCVYGIKHRGEHDKKDEDRWAYADHAAKNLFFVRKAVRSH